MNFQIASALRLRDGLIALSLTMESSTRGRNGADTTAGNPRSSPPLKHTNRCSSCPPGSPALHQSSQHKVPQTTHFTFAAGAGAIPTTVARIVQGNPVLTAALSRHNSLGREEAPRMCRWRRGQHPFCGPMQRLTFLSTLVVHVILKMLIVLERPCETMGVVVLCFCYSFRSSNRLGVQTEHQAGIHTKAFFLYIADLHSEVRWHVSTSCGCFHIPAWSPNNELAGFLNTFWSELET